MSQSTSVSTKRNPLSRPEANGLIILVRMISNSSYFSEIGTRTNVSRSDGWRGGLVPMGACCPLPHAQRYSRWLPNGSGVSMHHGAMVCNPPPLRLPNASRRLLRIRGRIESVGLRWCKIVGVWLTKHRSSISSRQLAVWSRPLRAPTLIQIQCLASWAVNWNVSVLCQINGQIMKLDEFFAQPNGPENNSLNRAGVNQATAERKGVAGHLTLGMLHACYVLQREKERCLLLAARDKERSGAERCSRGCSCTNKTPG